MELELITALYDQNKRQESAIRLASCFGSDNLIIFIEDPEIKSLLPGPGFSQTLSNGKAWRAFLELCQAGYQQAIIAQPSGPVHVTGFQGPDGSVAVFVGGTPNREDLEPFNKLLPLVTALLKKELSELGNKSLAEMAEKGTAKAEKLAQTLDVIRQQLHTALRKQEDDKKAIQLLMNKKDEFLDAASHKLKTPLTSLKAYMQMLEKIEKNAQAVAFLAKCSYQIRRLEKLIQDLLDVSKINGSSLSYTIKRFNIADALRESVSASQLSSATHEIIIGANPDIFILGDRNRIEQVITNFIANAIKYSPEANRVYVSSVHKGDNVIVSVKDFGIGISSEHLEGLFDRFYRVETTAMRFEGLGLGLFISSEILRRHNGNFWIESEVGKGSTFFFKLPTEMAEASAEPLSSALIT